MEQEFLQAAWQGVNEGSRNQEELRSMILEKRHPVLKRIRKQLIIEGAAFSVLLLVYYDFFDGDRKPFYANLLLVAALLLAIMHNIAGYLLTKRGMTGDNLRQSLGDHLAKLRVYAVFSVASRFSAAICLLIFFCSVIVFNTGKYLLLAGAIGILVLQISLLGGMWMTRIRKIKQAIGDLYS